LVRFYRGIKNMRSKEFQLRLSEEEVLYVKVIYFADSLFVYVGDDKLQMNNAYLAIQTKYVCVFWKRLILRHFLG